MFISDFAIKRPLITVVSMLALAVFGIFALLKLKTDEFPDVAPPFVSVGIVYPGASPDIVEKQVLDPVEEQIQAISGVKQVMGKAYDGYALILVEFLFEKDLNEATQDIRDGISTIRSDLPIEMKEPISKKENDTDRPIVSLALSSTMLSPAEMTRLVDPGITRELRSLPGVADVLVFGKQERELTVELKPQALQADGVSVGQVVQALQLQNLASPVGRITGSLDERSIRLKGRLESPEEFTHLVVAERNGQLIRLGQVAEIKDGTIEPRTLALYDSREAVGIDIKKSKGYSTTDVADRLISRVGLIKKRLPPGTTIEVVKNSGTRVDHAVRNVQEALIEGAILTVLVVFLPIGFMPGIGGQWFKPFALTIACSVLVSLFVSFSLDPMLSAYWADPHRLEHEKSRITKVLDRFNHWFNRQAQNYRKVIAWALDHRASMITIALGAFISAFVLPAKGLTGLAAAVVGVVIVAYAFSRAGTDPVVRAAIAVAGLVVAFVLVRAVPPVRTVGVG